MLSMTGYGRGECKRHGKKITVMANSVNRKQMDVRVSVPREIAFIEPAARQLIKDNLNRGAITVLIDYLDEDGGPTQAKLNQPLAESTWDSLVTLQENLGIDEKPKLSDLLAIPEIFSLGGEELTEEELIDMATAALKPAIEGLVATRTAEGATLKSDLLQRQEGLNEILQSIVKLAPQVPINYRKRLEQRLDEYRSDIDIDEERILKEILIFADRSDVMEETTRLASHLEQMLQLFETPGPVGRKLDFLIQELVREINTIGSKASDKDIALHVVEFKTELERIREQVQNIE